MLRRFATALALLVLLAPAARSSDWEEEYSDDWSVESPPPADDDYRVSVDVDAPPVNVETFQASLAPYGDWVVVGSYGRVWRPHVAAGWRPYYYGRWEWTNEGWLWVSDEPFGWAAYHYGRWTLEPSHGWVWVPGYEWAPAWVSWRYSGDVVGWAPLGPGVSVFVTTTPLVDAWWTFVPCRAFVAEPVHRVAIERTRTRRLYYDTAPAPARPGARGGPGRPVAAPAWGGPPPRAIEQRIGRPIRPVRVVAAPSPGPSRAGSGEVSIFRPGIRPGAPVARPAPSAGVREALPGRGGVRPDALRPRAGVPARVDPQERARGWAGEGRGAAAPGAPPPAEVRPRSRPQHREVAPAPRGFGGPVTGQGGPRGAGGLEPRRFTPPPAVRSAPLTPREARPAFGARPRGEPSRPPPSPQARQPGGREHRR